MIAAKAKEINTKRDFIYNIPAIIEHNTWGYSELEFIVDKERQKGVCYKNKDNTKSLGNYAETWQELYDKLIGKLIEAGYVGFPK
jgi:hypothetical protein